MFQIIVFADIVHQRGKDDVVVYAAVTVDHNVCGIDIAVAGDEGDKCL